MNVIQTFVLLELIFVKNSDLVKSGQLIVTQLQLRGISRTVEGILGDVFQFVVAQVQHRDVHAILKSARLYLRNFVTRQIDPGQVEILERKFLYDGDEIFGHVQQLNKKRKAHTRI